MLAQISVDTFSANVCTIIALNPLSGSMDNTAKEPCTWTAALLNTGRTTCVNAYSMLRPCLISVKNMLIMASRSPERPISRALFTPLYSIVSRWRWNAISHEHCVRVCRVSRSYKDNCLEGKINPARLCSLNTATSLKTN